jgi:hypothetical protein
VGFWTQFTEPEIPGHYFLSPRYFAFLIMAVNQASRNQWGIPNAVATAVIKRDTRCIYCCLIFDRSTRATAPSWEHIVNDETIITLANIALCCIGCNASKGTKSLADWLGSKYCQSRGITAETIAQVARDHLTR